MRRRIQRISGLASLIPLHTATDIPLQRQLYEGLRQAIVSRQLMSGARLPSTRALAGELGLSRTTVFQAYQQLLLEGYLEGRRGSGTYVARNISDGLFAPAQQASSGYGPFLIPATRRQSESGATSSTTFAARDVSAPSTASAPSTMPRLYANPAFRVGQPALDAFPHTLWQRLLAHNYRNSWTDLFGYQEAAGYQPLREAVASYLAIARGVRCTYQQVIIISGSQQGMDIIARTLLQPGDAIWMEDPGYQGARWAFQRAGLRLIPVPVDTAGFDLAAGQALYPDARLAYVTPSHQFPLGATMSMERRLALLEWARNRNGWILEDDYDSEYRYTGRPLPSLQGLDDAGRVLYLGTFSKVLFPSLRLGYLVVPPSLVENVVHARRGMDLHSPGLEQAVVADFMVEGHFQRHIRRMRTLYAERQALLHQMLTRRLSGLLEVQPDTAGMHLVAWLPPEMESQPVMQALRDAGLSAMPLAATSLRPLRRDALLLGYAAPDEEKMAEGVRILASILERQRVRRSLAVS